MWERFKRWVRSVFGGAIDSMEDPEKILRQNIRDMTDQIPRMNESLAMLRANVTLLANRAKKRQTLLDGLKAKIKAALQAGRRDIALTYATQMEQLQREIGGDQEQLRISEEGYEKAVKVKEAFLAEKRRKIEEAQQAIAKHKQSEWQKKVADAMESFEVAGVDQTHDEMIDRIEQESALNQARLEMALDNIDVHSMEIEREAQEIQANEILKQFEMELGLTDGEAAEKTLGPGEAVLANVEAETQAEEVAVAEPEVVKTVGPKKPGE
ncbi:MAG: PspA/IM30 family protein [Candidatus Lernaella stagnicola]|nr:PspA/IM30 family protein [Candidatus Lernaella stagnicola]